MITSKQILDAYHFRYACKKFNKDKVISPENFQTILETGRLSPRSFGLEPWKFLVIQNENLREELKECAWGAVNSLNGASHFVIFLARKKTDIHFDGDYLKHIMTDVKKIPASTQETMLGMLQKFQHIDFELGDNERHLFDWSCKQSYIALANMLTTAAFLEIDSCPIEGFNREKIEQILADKNLLDREHFGVAVMAGFGYRDGDPEFPKTRQDIDAVVEWIK